MGDSWSAIKKRLEEDLLATSLRGRLHYHLTRHRKSHDAAYRIAIYVDGELYIDGTMFKHYAPGYVQMSRDLVAQGLFYGNARERYDQMDAMRLEGGEFGSWMFDVALREFLKMDVRSAARHENPIIRMLAIVDRRLGKRSLERLKDDVIKQPEWLQRFYLLRMRAEGIRVALA